MLLISTCHRWGKWDTQMQSILPKVTEHLSRTREKQDPERRTQTEREQQGTKAGRMGERGLWEEVLIDPARAAAFRETRAVGPALYELFSCPAHFPMSLMIIVLPLFSVLKCLTHMCDKGSIWSHMYLVGSKPVTNQRKPGLINFSCHHFSWSSWFGSLFGHWFHSAWYTEVVSVSFPFQMPSSHFCEIKLSLLPSEGCSLDGLSESSLYDGLVPRVSRAGLVFPCFSWP